ncbi:HDOD domain-containing protein [Shewanella sp. SNU WT4]|uniref:HDOD domain-containing protein n=1 Tax=Shewanella sp. SNU WT4 TaxID=2590015 RepID=UPI001126D8C0|nr:HDOD domain-containing protein [Shewanella sp. SNU WT4]QDF66488.1 HDOD domain-containing protein [Shewanella sp. SNU WT4]
MPVKHTSNRLDYWINYLGEQELPALCSSIRSLESLADDNVSPLANISRSVMHDNALTSRILRVVNTVTYHKGGPPITTLSRAAVVLGFDVMRNICLTAKLLSTTIEKDLVTGSVYQMLLRQMARSFQAAMIGRMMQQQQKEPLREEVFIASLLFHLGETAFWSSAQPEVKSLAIKLQMCLSDAEQQQAIREVIGGRFNQLTLGLVTQWGLGALLQSALSQHQSCPPESLSIIKANELSAALEQGNPAEIEALIIQCAELLGEDIHEFTERLDKCLKATIKLTHAYGANELVEYLAPNIDSLHPKNNQSEALQVASAQHKQIQILSQLAALAGAKADFNPILQLVLEGLVDGVGLKRACVLLLTKDKRGLTPKMAYGDDCSSLKAELALTIDENPLIGRVIEDKTMMYYGQSQQWHEYLHPLASITLKANSLAILINRHRNKSCGIGAIVLENKVIGLVYFDNKQGLTESQIQGAVLFWQQANLCLNLAYQR